MEDLCTACLCSGRNLYFIGDTGAFDLYTQILNEIPVYSTSDLCVRICWECRALLRRLQRFTAQVKRSYHLLTQIHEDSVGSIARAPRLSVHNTCRISLPEDDILPTPKTEPDTAQEPVVKSEPEDGAEHSEETFVNDLLVERAADAPAQVDSEAAATKEVKKTRSKLKDKKTVKSTVKKKGRKRKRKLSISADTIDAGDADAGIDCDAGSVEGEEGGEQVEVGEEKTEEVVEKTVGNGDEPTPRVPTLGGERPVCVECGKVFSSKKTYRYHINVLHKGQNRYPCPRCGKVYQWKSNLGRHMRSHKARDSGELYCGECDKRFASVATYRQHLKVSRQHVSESEFSFMCTECGKKFVNKTRLRDHVDWEHLNNIKFRCQLCNKPFKCHTSLYVHMQNVHRDKEKKDNLCHVCGKSYQNAAKLKYHIIAMHTHETPYRCAQCGAAFGWYSSLYRHVREVHYKMKVQPKKTKRSKRGELPPPAPAHVTQ